MWWVYALLSALFASLTAIFAKVGITNVNSNLATAIRTIIILIVAWGIVLAKGEAKGLTGISKNNLFFLVISGIATSLSLTITLSVIFLGEALTLKTAIGALLIIAGTVVMIL